jgi:hypothetical protein
MASPKIPPFALVPAYLSQLPTSKRAAVITMAGLGPPLFKTQMTRLEAWLAIVILETFFSSKLLLVSVGIFRGVILTD